MNVYMDVSLQCLYFVWYGSGGRGRCCVAATRVAVYGGLNSEPVNAVKTVERSNRAKCFFLRFRSFFSDSAAPQLRNEGASPDVAQRSNCQGCLAVDVDRLLPLTRYYW